MIWQGARDGPLSPLHADARAAVTDWKSQLCKHSLPLSHDRKEKCQKGELGKTAKEQLSPEENMK